MQIPANSRSALAFAISQTVFLTKIFHHAESDPLTAAISRSYIVEAGATHLDRLTDTPAALNVLRKAYLSGFRAAMIVALTALCLSLLCIPGMEWLKLDKKVESADTDTAIEGRQADEKQDTHENSKAN